MAVRQIADRIKETTTTTGTGTITLGGAASGYRSFSTFADGDTCYYVIVGPTTQWEVGLGTVGGSGTTLARTTVMSSSNAGAAVSLSAGIKSVFCDRPTGAVVQVDAISSTRPFEMLGSGTGEGVNFGLLYNKNVFASGGAGNEAYVNDAVSLGLNVGDTIQVPGVAGKASSYFTIENKYYDTVRYVSELHFEFVNPAGTVFRAWSWKFPHTGTTGSVVGYNIDQMNWTNWAGTAMVQWNFAAGNTSANFLSSYYWNFAVNDYAFLRQRNAADSAYLNLPYFGSDNRLVISGAASIYGATPTTGTYANIFCAMQASSIPVNGILLSGDLGSVAGAVDAFQFAGSTTGVLQGRLYNQSNTGNAHAWMQVWVAGTSAGDPMMTFNVVGASNLLIGVDNSDSDKFKIATDIFGNGLDIWVLDRSGNQTWFGDVTMADAKNIVLNTGTGTKIGTATTQKLGFYNATPVAQGASVADATDAATAITQLNALISRIEATGLIATV